MTDQTTKSQYDETILNEILSPEELDQYHAGQLNIEANQEIQFRYKIYLRALTNREKESSRDEGPIEETVHARVTTELKNRIKTQAAKEQTTMTEIISKATLKYLDQQEGRDLVTSAQLQEQITGLINEIEVLRAESREMFAYLSYAGVISLIRETLISTQLDRMMKVPNEERKQPEEILAATMEIAGKDYHNIFDKVQYYSREVWLPHLNLNMFAFPLRNANLVKRDKQSPQFSPEELATVTNNRTHHNSKDE